LNWCATVCKGKFLLSSYNTDMLTSFIEKHGWHKKEITFLLDGKRDTRKKGTDTRTEILVSNYDTPCGTGNLFTKHPKNFNLQHA
jgi:hypothetical protein